MGKNDNKDLAVGHMACAAAYIIFGINVVVCRDIATDGGLAPIVLFQFMTEHDNRYYHAASGSTLFWKDVLTAPTGILNPNCPIRSKIDINDIHRLDHLRINRRMSSTPNAELSLPQPQTANHLNYNRECSNQ